MLIVVVVLTALLMQSTVNTTERKSRIRTRIVTGARLPDSRIAR